MSKPTDITIEVNFTGYMTIEFSKPIKFEVPEGVDSSASVNESKFIQESLYIELKSIDSQLENDNNLLGFTLQTYSETKLEVQLFFDKPDLVSMNFFEKD